VVLVLLAGAVGASCLVLWPKARAFAADIQDQLGVRLVEGHADLIDEAARESGVDPYLIGAVMFMESRGRGSQTSHAGAHGLMQLMPAAAEDAARRLNLPAPTVEEVLDDDRLNVRLGAAHLAWLLEHRGEWDLEAVLVSYNAGRTRLMRWIERHGSYAAWRAYEHGRYEAGEETTGTLEYATNAIAKRALLRERGVIRPVEGALSID
jgi:soluble lytic murein transglycosylase-like protein